ncbi:hypothetical protein, partial [Nonomuraea dietziae]|uniref:hypothetical protein n=1 Tax=Nonomuraea dietziae TaxID=65515 RepID=UPI003438103C
AVPRRPRERPAEAGVKSGDARAGDRYGVVGLPPRATVVALDGEIAGRAGGRDAMVWFESRLSR